MFYYDSQSSLLLDMKIDIAVGQHVGMNPKLPNAHFVFGSGFSNPVIFVYQPLVCRVSVVFS